MGIIYGVYVCVYVCVFYMILFPHFLLAILLVYFIFFLLFVLICFHLTTYNLIKEVRKYFLVEIILEILGFRTVGICDLME